MSTKVKGKQIEDHTITNQQIYIAIPPSAATDAVSKEYLEAYVMSGLTSGVTVIGAPRDGSWDNSTSDGLLSFTNDTLIGYAINDINSILAKLAPTPSPNLSTRTLSISSLYSAAEQGSGTVRTNVTDNTQPVASVSGIFSDADSGTLTAFYDSVSAGSRILTTSSDTGTYGALTITYDDDPYSGQTGKSGFYKSLNATVRVTSPISASNVQHTYGLSHSLTGSVPNLAFYIDSPLSSSIMSNNFTLPASTTRYISGVPSLASGQQISVNYVVQNAVGYYYNSTRIGVLGGSYTSSVNSPQPYPVPTNGQTVSFTGQTVTVNNSVFGALTMTVTPYNSKGTSGAVQTISTNAYVDTVSVETIRRTSSTGQYPTSGYGSTYDSTKSIKSDAGYTEELQLVNGLFQYPVTNYSTYTTPTVGPDYSVGMTTSSGYRWVTFNVGTITSKSTIDFTFTSPQNFTGTVITSGMLIYLKCEGVTGWINGNAAYSASIPSPSVDGDPAMVYANSTTTVKRITFGATPRTGQLYLRVGLPTSSNIRFANVTYTVIN